MVCESLLRAIWKRLDWLSTFQLCSFVMWCSRGNAFPFSPPYLLCGVFLVLMESSIPITFWVFPLSKYITCLGDNMINVPLPLLCCFLLPSSQLNNCLLRMQNVFWSHQNATKHWQNQRFNIIILDHYQKTQFACCHGQNDVVSRFFKENPDYRKTFGKFLKVNLFAWSLEQWVNVTTILSSLYC